MILDLLASGLSVEGVLEQYPQLSRKDILACLAYGAYEDISLKASG